MARQLQLRRGTTAENERFVGAPGEVTYDVEKKELHVHDGTTEGGTIVGSGSGSISNIDKHSITLTSTNVIQASASVNQNASATTNNKYVYDWVGTLDEYNNQNIHATHPEWICYITDDYISDFSTHNPVVSGYNIGDIFFTSRLDSMLNGAVATDGTTYDLNDFSGADSINSVLLDGRIPYITLAQYETKLANDGVVGFIGWDGPGTSTFRVPYLNDLFIESTIANNLGEFVSAGLPNITSGNASVLSWNNDQTQWGTAGALTLNDGQDHDKYGTLNINTEGHWTNTSIASFNAHTENTIYGNSTTVQPKAVRYRSMIQLFNGYTDEAFLKCTSSLAHRVVEFLKPTSSNNYTWYRKYADGWVEQGGIVTTTTFYFTVTFPIVMANTYYFTAVTRSSQSDATMMMSAAKEKTTTSMKVLCGSATGTGVAGDIAWQVCGMAA